MRANQTAYGKLPNIKRIVQSHRALLKNYTQSLVFKHFRPYIFYKFPIPRYSDIFRKIFFAG